MTSTTFRLALSSTLSSAMFALSSVFGLNSAFAGSLQFTNISQDDFVGIAREFSANSTLHTVMPPSSLGSIFGFEVGVLAGATQSPTIEALVKEVDASSEVGLLPHAGLLGAVSVPFGFTAEVAFVPTIKTEGASMNQFAAALKWNLSDGILAMLPINLAVRGFISKTDLSFTQNVNNPPLGNVPVTVDYEGQVLGGQLLVSPKLIPIIEPYIGVGYLSAKGDMNITGSSSATFFSGTSSQSASAKPTSSQLLIGANVTLIALVLGLEYSRAFETDSVTAKVGIRL